MDKPKIDIVEKNPGSPRAEMDVSISTSPIKDMNKYEPVMNYLEVADPYTEDNQKKLEYVWDYLSDRFNRPSEKVHHLRTLKQKMSTPAIGENWLNKIYNYLRVKSQSDEASEIGRAFLKPRRNSKPKSKPKTKVVTRTKKVYVDIWGNPI